MNTVVKKFALVALCTTALTAVSQTAQAGPLVFDISGGTVPVFSYNGAVSSDNVVNAPGSPVTGSTVYDLSATADWEASTAATSSAAAINSVLSVSGLAANQQYTVAFTFAGSEADNTNQFSVAPTGNVVTNGAIATSTTGANHNLNSNYNGNPQVGPTVSMGGVRYVNTGPGGNIPGFTVTDPAGIAPKAVTNGGTNAVPGGGKASLIFSYAIFDGTNYTLTTIPSDFVVFGFNDSGSGDDNHDDFVGIATLAIGSNDSGPTPIPAALPLFGSVLGGGYLFSKWRRKRKAAAIAAA
jgi:hypothetical protein